MATTYMMCPCCGRRSIALGGTGKQENLFDRAMMAQKNGGDVWVMKSVGLGRGRGFTNENFEADVADVEKVQAELAYRCRAFLKKYDAQE